MYPAQQHAMAPGPNVPPPHLQACNTASAEPPPLHQISDDLQRRVVQLCAGLRDLANQVTGMEPQAQCEQGDSPTEAPSVRAYLLRSHRVLSEADHHLGRLYKALLGR